MMMKYRKKPVVMEAFKWTGDIDQTEDPEWICDAIRSHQVYFSGTPVQMLITTPEGTKRADQGDWIIKDVNGEIYPCKRYIFEKTYEPA